MYEAIAAGGIPVIVADKLQLPFARQMNWESMSLRYSEQVVAKDPKIVLRDVMAMPAWRLQ